jgi:hypothetical protein
MFRMRSEQAKITYLERLSFARNLTSGTWTLSTVDTVKPKPSFISNITAGFRFEGMLQEPSLLR